MRMAIAGLYSIKPATLVPPHALHVAVMRTITIRSRLSDSYCKNSAHHASKQAKPSPYLLMHPPSAAHLYSTCCGLVGKRAPMDSELSKQYSIYSVWSGLAQTRLPPSHTPAVASDRLYARRSLDCICLLCTLLLPSTKSSGESPAQPYNMAFGHGLLAPATATLERDPGKAVVPANANRRTPDPSVRLVREPSSDVWHKLSDLVHCSLQARPRCGTTGR